MSISAGELAIALAEETAELTNRMLDKLPARDWEKPTPAPGWAVRDQVSHLAYFDDRAMQALTDPAGFRAHAEQLFAGAGSTPDDIAEQYRSLTPDQLLEWLRGSRSKLVAELGRRDPKERVPWYGPDMSVASMTTARLMETWAHGQDVADALGIEREATDRLQHVAHLGVRTMGFSFVVNGRMVPADPVRVELTGPYDDKEWTWGPPEAADRVSGPAEDFCLVVTQRRHLADTALQVSGPVATDWMSIAQAFAGPPGPGRARGQFSS